MGMLRDLIHDQPAINHKADAARWWALVGLVLCPARELEQCDIEHACLARTRRHPDHFWPAVAIHYLLGQAVLPLKRRPWFIRRAVDGLIELRKLSRAQVCHARSFIGRISPRPK